MTTLDHQKALEALDIRLRTLLPEEYQDSYEDVQPVSMGSAALKYDADGQVAWNEIWGSFCDLAMAGGPPHKGKLLEPATSPELTSQPEQYAAVVEELCRGISMVTLLPAQRSPIPGWVRVDCLTEAMAGWLLRAIVMENVAARAEHRSLDLPAAPGYRLEKEIKNVITVIAKTCHYWEGHMPRVQQRAIAALFAELSLETPLIQPALVGFGESAGRCAIVAERVAETIRRDTGLPRSPHRYGNWVGVVCPSVRAAIWMMRALVAGNVLARREETCLFLPINPASDPLGESVSHAATRVHQLAAASGI